MDNTTLSLDEDNLLLCPSCQGHCVHIDYVHVSGRSAEDGPTVELQISKDGSVVNREVGLINEHGRRHSFALEGWCEFCEDTFTIEFRQHKGSTWVETVRYRMERERLEAR